MKKLIAITLISSFILSGCGGPKSLKTTVTNKYEKENIVETSLGSTTVKTKHITVAGSDDEYELSNYDYDRIEAGNKVYIEFVEGEITLLEVVE